MGITAISLYLLLPSLLAVFASWRSLSHLNWYFAALVLAFEAASFVCLWELDRIALHTRAWFPVAAAQLSGNAVGRILPGGVRDNLQHRCCARPGSTQAGRGGAFESTAAPQIATALAHRCSRCPMSAAYRQPQPRDGCLPGPPTPLVLLIAAGVAAFATDAPVELAGRAISGS